MHSHWVLFALASAVFAALTAIFGKLGVIGLNSNLATLVRTIVILGVIAGIVTLRGEWQAPGAIGARSWLFLVLSGIATGLSCCATTARCNWGRSAAWRRSTSSAWR
jgi:transporter family protein